MFLETLALDKAVLLATPVAKKIFSSKIEPFISKNIDRYFKNKAAAKAFEKNSVKYLAKIAGQCSTLNTIAFQNAPKRLDDLYIPLTIKADAPNHELKVTHGTDIFADRTHILINDTAGMGKSTLSKRIVLNIIDAGEYVPVFIELRQLEAKPVEAQIRNIFGIPDDASEDLIKDLPLIYVFDGLDEVPNDKKKDVVKYLKEFIEYVGDSKILITSRQETFLSEFYSFSRYSISPLSKQEAFELLKKYDPANELAATLIAGIEHERSSMIRDFLKTPLYVSLLFCSYRHKTIIPQKKDLFYSQVYDALFESHDLSKEIGFVRPKYSKLDSTDFHSVLRRLGFWCLKNNGKIEFQKDELQIVVADLISKISGLKANSSDFVKDLTMTVPLFVAEGPSLRWSHKSLMEYFAAMFICNDIKDKRKDVLLKLYVSENAVSNRNVLALCFDIDFSSFRASILKHILQEFADYKESVYKNVTNKRISKAQIEARIAATFGRAAAFRILPPDVSAEYAFVRTTNRNMQRGEIVGIDQRKIARSSETFRHFTPPTHSIFCSMLNADILDMIRKKVPYIFSPKRRARIDDFKTNRFKVGQYYVINDDPKSPVNSSTHFDMGTMIATEDRSAAVLNAEAALKELAEIRGDASNGVDSLVEDF